MVWPVRYNAAHHSRRAKSQLTLKLRIELSENRVRFSESSMR
ncbi:hypothetical protein SJ05684_c21370 [Sinorhizobium sojae CCBAU 05684]|uniref:Uncharacterized protein n=1 Tax=Sinorhizobium sojae CCBAU 05684 TaxID=716928 RepID=A0A249PCE1_9HYPH|nr:hypothetical protein SJ05684_c21370 [Sinorhizobium sojae CCBAU 05684]